jgi:excisionase family DNA binding protein
MTVIAPHLLTAAELAAALRTSERTAARMVNDGCPSMMVGRRRRFELQAVLAWSAERAARSPMETQACPSDRTPTGAGTSKCASSAAEYTAAARRVQLRVMPSDSKLS